MWPQIYVNSLNMNSPKRWIYRILIIKLLLSALKGQLSLIHPTYPVNPGLGSQSPLRLPRRRHYKFRQHHI